MPGGFPLALEICAGNSNGAVLANDGGTAVTAGSANTMGSYTQLVASTSNDTSWIVVQVDSGPSISGWGWGVDIAVGGAGSEVIIINQLSAGIRWNISGSRSFAFPCSIPAGTRIAARVQCATASAILGVSVMLFDAAFTQMEGCAGADSIGWVSASTQGTTLDGGAVAHTKGAYAQLVASTSQDYIGVLAAFDSLNAVPTTGYGFLVDIAIGGAGSEQIIIPNIVASRIPFSAVAEAEPVTPFFPIPIPAGTRIAARCSATGTTANSRTIGVTVYGIYQ